MAFNKARLIAKMTLMDYQHLDASHSLIFPGATTIAAAETFMTAYVVPLGQVSPCTLMQYQLLSQYRNDEVIIAVNSDVEEPGVFYLVTEGGASFIGESTSVFSLPAIHPEKLSPGTDNVNIADTDAAALIDALINGLSGVQPCDYRGFSFSALEDARREGRRSHLKRAG